MGNQWDDDTDQPATRADVLSAGLPNPTAVARARLRVRAERLAARTAFPAAPPVEPYAVEVGRPDPSGHVALFLPHVLDADGDLCPLELTPSQVRDLWRALDALMQPETGGDEGEAREASTSAEAGVEAAGEFLRDHPDAGCAQVAAYAARAARAAHLAPGMAAFHGWLEAADNGALEPQGAPG